MKRTLIAAAVLTLAFALPAFAADGAQPAAPAKPTVEGGQSPKAGKEAKASGDSFAERKNGLIKRIDDRMAALVQEKKCVKAAKNQDEIKACRGKRGPDGDERRGRGKKRDGGAPRGR